MEAKLEPRLKIGKQQKKTNSATVEPRAPGPRSSDANTKTGSQQRKKEKAKWGTSGTLRLLKMPLDIGGISDPQTIFSQRKREDT